MHSLVRTLLSELFDHYMFLLSLDSILWDIIQSRHFYYVPHVLYSNDVIWII